MNEKSKDYYTKCAYPKQAVKKKKREVVTDRTYYKTFTACKGTCVLCGTKQNLELHHILGRGKNLTNNANLCVMLCYNCHHNVVHANLKKYRPILIKIARDIYKEYKTEIDTFSL